MTLDIYRIRVSLIKQINEELKKRIVAAVGAKEHLVDNEAELKALREKYPEYEI